MKNQIQIIVKTRKIEALFLGIMGLVLLIAGSFISVNMGELIIGSEIPINIFQKFFIVFGVPFGGILGIILGVWQYIMARKIEFSE
jgi:hypothetical protein